MKQIISAIFLVVLCVYSFVVFSGWAEAHHLFENFGWLFCSLSIILFLNNTDYRLPISKTLLVLIILFLGLIPHMISGKWEGASYLISFLVVYIVSMTKITQNVITLSALPIALWGLIIMSLQNGPLEGWNENAISMTGLFCFLYFCIFLITISGKKRFWLWNIVSFMYFTALTSINCRSGQLICLIAIIGLVLNNLCRYVLSKKIIRLVILNFPLAIALSISAISNSSIFPQLEMWSYRKFNKPVFNGRDELWNEALIYLEKSNYLGIGEFPINFHNSGIAALTVFGIVGYIIWIKFFSSNLNYISKYLNDRIVFGSTFAFILIFIQQSFDLGFIAPVTNLIPYMILGIALGRIRYIKNKSTVA